MRPRCISSHSRAAGSPGATRRALLFRLNRPSAHTRRARDGACRPLGRTRGRRGRGARRGARQRPSGAGDAVRSERWRAAAVSRAPPRKAGRRRAEILRGFPERRDGARSRARAAGRIPLDRARQALHHGRHGDRPGQDLEHERARHRRRHSASRSAGGRPHDLPHAVHAGHFRRACRPRRAARCSIRCARRRCTTGPARAARCSRTSASGNARATSRARARTCTPPSRANAAPCATGAGVFDASTLGKIEVVGPRRARSS